MTADLHTAARATIDRVREAIRPGAARSDALRYAAAAAGVAMDWDQANLIAEALRHRYDGVVKKGAWLRVSAWRDPEYLDGIRRHLRTRLVDAADEQGMALVEEPVEYRYAPPDLYQRDLPAEDDERGRTPLTAEQVNALPDDAVVQVCLVGHVHRLGGAR
jgi:hypothetical protein